MLNLRRVKILFGMGVILVPSLLLGNPISSTTEAQRIGYTNVEALNMRSYPDIAKSSIMTKLKLGQEVKILYKVDKFYKVLVNDTYGFVFADYIDLIGEHSIQEQNISEVRDIVLGEATVDKNADSDTEGVSVSNELVTEKQLAKVKSDNIVAMAKQYLGKPYVYGGTNLQTGTDCSGFTQGIMKLVGINIPRTSKAQSQNGVLVARNELQKGDLLFFGSNKESIFHTGIYIGDGKMIHSSTSARGVIIADAFNGGGAPLQLIRRV